MKLKYNIALIPNNISDQFIELSQSFSKIAKNYLLGPNSLPHVTLYQFNVEETEVNFIWERVFALMDEKAIHLQFKEFSYISFDNTIYWVSLLPNHCEDLNKIHCSIANIIKLPVKTFYDPHLTLINTTDSECQNKINEFALDYAPISDTFSLSLGKCDDIGQYTEIIHACDLGGNNRYKYKNII